MAQYYVDAGIGDDANSGAKEDEPKKTLAAASALLSGPGDVLNISVRQEFFEELKLENISGTPSNPIIIRSWDLDVQTDDPTRARINGNGVSLTTQGLVYGRNINYVTFQNIEIVNSPDYGVQLHRYTPISPIVWPSNTGVVFDGVIIDYTINGGIVFEYCKDCTMRDSIVQRTNIVNGADEAITLRCNEGTVIRNNTVRWCAEEGIDIKDGSLSCTVNNNLIYDCKIGVYLNHARSCRVFENVIHSCGMGTAYGQSSGISLAVGDGAEVTLYDVGGNKERDHADVDAAIKAGTPINITVATSSNATASRNLTSNNFIYRNFSGFNGYCGIDAGPSLTDGEMTGNVFANNVLYKNGFYPGLSYGGGAICEPGASGSPDLSVVFDGNTFINNLSAQNADHSWIVEADNTLTNNVAFSDVTDSVDTATMVTWGWTVGDANALKTAVDTLTGSHTEPSALSETSLGAFNITNLSISAGLQSAGVSVSAVTHDGESFPSIDDSSIGFNGDSFTVGATLDGDDYELVKPEIEDYSLGFVDRMHVSNSVLLTELYPTFTFYGNDFSEDHVLTRSGQEYGLEIASTGTLASRLYDSPWSDGDVAINPQGGKVYQHSIQSFNQPTTDDFIIELIYLQTETSDANGSVIISTQNSDSDVGFTVKHVASQKRLEFIVNDGTGAVTLQTSDIPTNPDGASRFDQWHHVVFGCDRDVGLYAIVDGVDFGDQAGALTNTVDGGTNKLTIMSRPDFSDKMVDGQALMWIAMWESSGLFKKEAGHTFAVQRNNIATDGADPDPKPDLLDPSGLTTNSAEIWQDLEVADNVFYVDAVVGNDSNDGKTRRGAFKTLAAAIANLQNPGDRLLVSANGEFNEQLSLDTLQGTVDHPIRIDGFDPQLRNRRAVINGTGVSTSTGGGLVYVTDSSYVELQRLEILNSDSMGIRVYGTQQQGVRIEDCVVDCAATNGITIDTGLDCVVRNCLVQRCNYSDSVDKSVRLVTCTTSTVRDTTVRWSGATGIVLEVDCVGCTTSNNLVHWQGEETVVSTAGSSLSHYKGNVDEMSNVITVDGTDVTATWAYYSGDASDNGWYSKQSSANTLDYASTGDDPNFAYDTPFSDGSIGLDPSNGNVFQGPSQAFGQPTTDDVIWELVYRQSNSVSDNAIVSTQDLDSDTGFTIKQKGGGVNKLEVIINDGSGAVTFLTDAVSDAEWHHAFIGFDRSVGLYAYIDGLPRGTQAAVKGSTLDGGSKKLTILSRPDFSNKLVPGQALAYIAQFEATGLFLQSDVLPVAKSRYAQGCAGALVLTLLESDASNVAAGPGMFRNVLELADGRVFVSYLYQRWETPIADPPVPAADAPMKIETRAPGAAVFTNITTVNYREDWFGGMGKDPLSEDVIVFGADFNESDQNDCRHHFWRLSAADNYVHDATPDFSIGGLTNSTKYDTMIHPTAERFYVSHKGDNMRLYIYNTNPFSLYRAQPINTKYEQTDPIREIQTVYTSLDIWEENDEIILLFLTQEIGPNALRSPDYVSIGAIRFDTIRNEMRTLTGDVIPVFLWPFSAFNGPYTSITSPEEEAYENQYQANVFLNGTVVTGNRFFISYGLQAPIFDPPYDLAGSVMLAYDLPAGDLLWRVNTESSLDPIYHNYISAMFKDDNDPTFVGFSTVSSPISNPANKLRIMQVDIGTGDLTEIGGLQTNYEDAGYQNIQTSLTSDGRIVGMFTVLPDANDHVNSVYFMEGPIRAAALPPATEIQEKVMANPQTITAAEQFTTPLLVQPGDGVTYSLAVGGGDTMTATVVFEKSDNLTSNYKLVASYTTVQASVSYQNNTNHNEYVRLRATAHSGDDVIATVTAADYAIRGARIRAGVIEDPQTGDDIITFKEGAVAIVGDLTATGDVTVTGTVTGGGLAGSLTDVVVDQIAAGASAVATDAQVTVEAVDTVGTTQKYVEATGEVTSAAGTTALYGLYSDVSTNASAYTCALRAQVVSAVSTKGSGSTITSDVGVSVALPTQGTENVAVLIGTAPAGSTDYAIYSGGTTRSYFGGPLEVATATGTAVTLQVRGTAIGGSTPSCVNIAGPTWPNGTATLHSAFSTDVSSGTGSNTVDTFAHFNAKTGTINSSFTVTREVKFLAGSPFTGGGTHTNSAVLADNETFTGDVFIHQTGTSASTFGGITTFNLGMRTQVDTSDTANPPTHAEIQSAFGSPAAKGSGWIGIMDDNAANANNYLVFNNGSSWWYITATKGA